MASHVPDHQGVFHWENGSPGAIFEPADALLGPGIHTAIAGCEQRIDRRTLKAILGRISRPVYAIISAHTLRRAKPQRAGVIFGHTLNARSD